MYFQSFHGTDGTKTLAATWPSSLTYMSGNMRNLEVELIIGWDNLAHALQKLLNVNNIGHSPVLAHRTYHPETETTFNSNSTDNLPPMGAAVMYHQAEYHRMTSAEEENRKYDSYF